MRRRHPYARAVEAGMTLIEILVVLAIMSLIAASIGVMIIHRWREAQVRTAGIQIRELAGNAQQFVMAHGRCPLVDDLIAARYTAAEPRDPWGTAIAIRCPGEHDPDSPDILSFGPDRKEGTDDDIKSWKP